MKLMHSTTTVLNTKEFNQLSDKIIEAFYDLNPDIQDLYDIHINYIEDEWVIDFLPLVDDIPVIKVNTHIDQNDNGKEFLKVHPANLTDIPGILKFKDETKAYDLCMNYVEIFEFILALYDFEFRLT